MADKVYLAIDLKSFYASVECVERGLDPLTTNLVVADLSRTEKTICLAVTPALKAYGISGRARLFEVVERVKQVNAERLRKAPGRAFAGSSANDPELKAHPELALDYLVAPPRMKLYMDYSARVFEVYLKYIAPEDIHPYSIDEVFMDVTNYLDTYGLTPRELARKMILDVLRTVGVTATAGIGPNLYLCKVAMDIMAKHIKPDPNGVRVAQLNEFTYRRLLWDHRPLTDFGLLQRENAGPALWGQCGAADRPRLGLGALHHCGHQGLQTGVQQHRLRTGAAGTVFLRQGQAGRVRNGGPGCSGLGG